MEQPPSPVSVTVEPGLNDTLPGPTEESEVQVLNGGRGAGVDWPWPPLAGMFPYDDEMLFHDVEWEGIVSIEPPCVYFIFDPDSRALLDGQLTRLAWSLPYPLVRFDENTQTLWYRDIPIFHGDRVLTGGNEGAEKVGGKEIHELHLFWDACNAHGIAITPGFESVERLCSNKSPELAWRQEEELERICVEDTRPWNQRELLEQQGIATAAEPPTPGRGPGQPPPEAELAPPSFSSMHAYHPDMELELAKLVGVLSIELTGPNYYPERVCAYLYPTAASASQTVLWGDSWKHTGPDGQPLAVALDLPYPQVRFDEENQTLWNGDIGPMATGDRVIADPIAPPDFNNDYGNHKQPHEPLGDVCEKANASATVLDIQPVEHYCTHNPPPRHRSQCEQAISPQTQSQNHLTPPK